VSLALQLAYKEHELHRRLHYQHHQLQHKQGKQRLKGTSGRGHSGSS
jgi:hypothetical protein